MVRIVIVRQLEPGVRLRSACWLAPGMPDVEAVAHAVFDLALQSGGRDVPMAELRLLVEQLQQGAPWGEPA